MPRVLFLLGAIALAAFIAWLALKTSLTMSPEEALARGIELLDHRRVLVVAAHPDDTEWYVGGTCRLLADNGASVHVVVASNGEKGPNRIGAPNLAETRQREQLEAADINGYSEVRFLHLPDRSVAADERTPILLREIIDLIKPDLILTFDPHLPSLPYLHSDHQGIGAVVLSVWNDLPDKPALYFWQTRRPDCAVDITKVIDTKLTALASHRSQGGNRIPGRARSVNQANGRLVGVSYAELFRQAPYDSDHR